MQAKHLTTVAAMIAMVGLSGVAAADDVIPPIPPVIPKDCRGVLQHVGFRDGPLDSIGTGTSFSMPVDMQRLAIGVFEDKGWVTLDDGLNYYEYEFTGSTKYDDARDRCWA